MLLYFRLSSFEYIVENSFENKLVKIRCASISHTVDNVIVIVYVKVFTTKHHYSIFIETNAIDYVQWDDPNELVNRMQLLEALRQVGHNAHDNEMLSIIEEFAIN